MGFKEASAQAHGALKGRSSPMTYRPPVNEMLFLMRHVGGLDRAIGEGIHGDLSLDLVQDVLQEAGRFAGEVIAPINRGGDRHGVALRDGVVTTAPGFKQAYQAWADGGWNALGAPAEYGGQDRKSTRLNSSHLGISYAVFCLKKKKKNTT